MSRGLVFWIIMLVWLVLEVLVHFSVVAVGPLGGLAILFILLALLGWQVFGAPVR